MTTDPLALLGEVDRATGRLLETAAELDPDPGAPCMLPGWTRGHVLTHVARNADALGNLVTWARTGVVTPAYPSREHRKADIEAGSRRPWEVLLADVRDSSARFAEAAGGLSVDAWLAELDLPDGRHPAAVVPWRRLREVEVHHVDLAAGYTPDGLAGVFRPPAAARGGRRAGRRLADPAPGRARAPGAGRRRRPAGGTAAPRTPSPPG